jgi:hypothetical protein
MLEEISLHYFILKIARFFLVIINIKLESKISLHAPFLKLLGLSAEPMRIEVATFRKCIYF